MSDRYVEPMFIDVMMHRNMSSVIFNNQQILERCMELKHILDVKSEWFCDTYNSLESYDHREDDIFNQLIDKAGEEVIAFSNQYMIYPKKIQCYNAWFNIASKGNYQEFHQHPMSHFSVVYYVKVPEDSGCLIIRNQNVNSDMFPLIKAKQFNSLNQQTFKFKPSNQDLIIFRSNIQHMVEKNNSEEDRVSIAMNFILE